MEINSFSHVGKRNDNQDYVLTERYRPDFSLHVVADGMGGYEYGGLAAEWVAETLLGYFSIHQTPSKEEIQKAINKANLRIKQEAEKRQEKIGATVAGILIQGDTAHFFWVGDVRIIHFSQDEILFESKDHSLMNELLDNGSIQEIQKAKKYRHIVTRSVQGDIDKSAIGYHCMQLKKGDTFCICTDGVHEYLDSMQIQKKLRDNIPEGMKSIERYLAEVGKDNYSMLVGYNI